MNPITWEAVERNVVGVTQVKQDLLSRDNSSGSNPYNLPNVPFNTYIDPLNLKPDSSFFSYGGFTRPERDPFRPQKVIARIEYEGITAERAFYIRPKKEATPSAELNTPLATGVLSPAQDRINPLINPAGDVLTNLNNNYNINPSGTTTGSVTPYILIAPSTFPTNLRGTPGDDRVELEWQPVINTSELIGYNLFRGMATGQQDPVPVTDFPITETKYTDFNVKNGTTYYYIARALYKDSRETPPSNEIEVSPSATKLILLQIGNPIMIVDNEGKEIDSGNGTSPVITNGRTMVPIRAIIEAMGGTIGWDGTQRKVTTKLNDTNIELWIGNKTAKVNGISKITDVPPQVINGRTMLPLRFISENLGCDVTWDGEIQTITIKYIPPATSSTQPVSPAPTPPTNPATPPVESPAEPGHTPTLTTWAGNWLTTLGLMKLTQESYDVEGDCTTNQGIEGTVAGTASGGKLVGYFYLGADEGEYEITMSEDGKSFKGQYRLYGYDNWYSFTGLRQN